MIRRVRGYVFVKSCKEDFKGTLVLMLQVAVVVAVAAVVVALVIV